jgi:hypothetical protein
LAGPCYFLQKSANIFLQYLGVVEKIGQIDYEHTDTTDNRKNTQGQSLSNNSVTAIGCCWGHGHKRAKMYLKQPWTDTSQPVYATREAID